MKLRMLTVVFLCAAIVGPSTGRAQAVQNLQDQKPTTAAQQPLPTDRSGLETRGDIAMARKDYRDAVDIYTKALSLDPKSAVLHNKIGIAWHQQFRLDVARKYYEKAMKLDNKYAEPINNVGTIYYSQKKYGTAIRRYERALKLNPMSASIYSNLGTAEFARKKYQAAFDAYRKALELDAEVFERKSTYGVLLQERSVEDRMMFHFYLAKTYAAANLHDKALEYLRKAFEEGYKDREKLETDPSFAELIKTPGYAELIQNPPTAIK